MDNEELLRAIQDKIRLGVMEGMASHIQEKHTPLEAKVDTVAVEIHKRINGLDRQLVLARGVMLGFSIIFSIVLALVEYSRSQELSAQPVAGITHGR